MEKQEAKPLGALLKQLITDTGLREGLQRIDIYDAWDAAVGERAAVATISRYFKDGILFCTMSSSMIRNQLYYSLEGLRKKINSGLVGEPVKKIILK